MIVKKISVLEKLFVIYICLIPILEYYNSPIIIINFSTFLAILFGFAFAIIRLFHKRSVCRGLVAVSFVYVLFITINVLVTSSLYHYALAWNNVSSLFRLIVLFVCVVFLGHPFFNFRYAVKVLRVVICTASIIIVLQYILKYSIGYSFRPLLIFMLRDKGYAEVGTRFSAFYMEPAHYAYSASLYLVLELFSHRFAKKNIICVVITVLGIVLSGSGQGYLFVFIIFIFWFLKMLYLIRKNSKFFFIASGSIILLAAVCFCAFQIPYVHNSLSRVMSGNNAFGGIALDGRISTKVFFETLDKEKKLFGIGFGHINDLTDLFVSSLYTHLIECGYLSIPFLVLLMLPCLFEKRYYKIILSVFFALTVFFASGANPATLTFFLPFVYLDRQGFGVITIKKPLYQKCINRIVFTE